MNRRAVILALVCGLVTAGAVAPARATAPRMENVLVVLKSQADLSPARTERRAARLATIERILRTHADQTQRRLRQVLAGRKADGEVARITPLWVSNEIAVRATPAVVAELATLPEVASVEPDESFAAPAVGTATATPAAPNVSLINAPALWNLGFRGQGVVVANMDTGVDVTHPDLAGSWRGGSDSWYDPNGEHPTTPTDVNGHGTWTMGVMVGGSGSGSTVGVAPGAKWIAVKIFNDRGVASTSGIHQGFQWLLDPDGNPATPDAPNVVNDSWTMSGLACNLEFQPDLRNLRAAGILPVFAAGNDGPSARTVFSPADNPEAFSVGGTDSNDALDPYSSRGPSACAGVQAPRLTAPDTSIVSTDLYGGYATETGTSLAAPEASGALALLMSAFGPLSADQQEAALQNGAHDLGAPGPDTAYGFGRLDVLGSYQWLTSTPDFTVAAAPSTATVAADGTALLSVTVSSVRGFTGDVSLSVTGLPAGATATFTPSTVTGGSGSAQLLIANAGAAAAGSYPLSITAASGATVHTTPATLVVPGQPDFSVAASPTAQQVVSGTSVGYTLTTTALNGFSGDISLSAAGLPASVGAMSITPAVVPAAGTAAVTVAVASGAAPGTYPFTVTASSAALSHLVTLSVTVKPPPDFTLSISPTSRTVARGATASYTVQIAALNGYNAATTLTAGGLSASVGTATFTPAVINGAGSAQLAVATAANAPAGSYHFTVTASSPGLVHTMQLTLTVTVPDFNLSVSPSSASVTRGQSASYTVSVSAVNGFAANVNLSVTGLPTGTTGTFSLTKLAPGRSTTLRVVTSSATPRGTFTLKVSGAANGLSHTTGVSLIVR